MEGPQSGRDASKMRNEGGGDYRGGGEDIEDLFLVVGVRSDIHSRQIFPQGRE